MNIGVPKETKIKEDRVACTPAGVRMLVQAGHKVCVQAGAGDGSGFADEAYAQCVAVIVPTAADAWGGDLVIKVKELRLGLNTHAGAVTCKAVADAHGLPYREATV